MIISKGETGSITEPQDIDVCMILEIDTIVQSRGSSGLNPQVCNMNSMFQLIQGSSYIPIVLPSQGMLKAEMAFLPTKKKTKFCIAHIRFKGLSVVEGMTRECFDTPDSFTSHYKMPTVSSLAHMSRTLLLGSRGEQDAPSMTQEGVSVITTRIMSQNSITPLWMLVLREENLTPPPINVFTTNDPDSPTHWLNQLRIYIQTKERDVVDIVDGNVDGRENFLHVLKTSELRGSLRVNVTIQVLHSCDRSSCLGCRTLRLQSLCYAAQQCSIARCIGTVVNQNRPLCNVGLFLQTTVRESLSLLIGAWLIFTESYGDILSLSLDKKSRSGMDIQWIDDGFYGYICSAKDRLGQASAILTSTVGAVIFTQNQNSRDVTREQGGARKIDTTASTSIILNSINSFLYQLSLLPLYTMIATQKVMVCTTRSVTGIIGTSGFEITIGRGDLQRASDVAAGNCMSSLYEAKTDDIASQESQETIDEGANEILKRGGNTAIQAFKKADLKGSSNRYARFFSRLQSRIPLHYLDSMISYALGVVSGLQDMSQALDVTHCKVTHPLSHLIDFNPKNINLM